MSWTHAWISFDMSREGLLELEALLAPAREAEELTPELQNFHNEIQNMLERAPELLPLVEESSWLDE